MELADSDGSTRDVRKIDKRITFGTLATVSAIILGGSLFANANNEPMAIAEVSVTSSPAAATPSSSSTAKAVATKNPQSLTTVVAATNIKQPAIATLPQGGDDEEYEDEGHEGRNNHRYSDNDDDEDEEDEDEDD
jgi:hypothetical protein